MTLNKPAPTLLSYELSAPPQLVAQPPSPQFLGDVLLSPVNISESRQIAFLFVNITETTPDFP